MAIGIGVAIPKVISRAVGSAYSVGGKDPKLVADFDDEYYRANGGKTTFSNLITHSRTSNATMVDSDGLIKWGPHNLLTYSEDLSQASTVYGDGVISNTNDFTFTSITTYLRWRPSFTVDTKGKYTAKVTISGGEIGDTFDLELVDNSDGSDSFRTVVTIDGSTNQWTIEADFSASSTFSGNLALYINRVDSNRSITTGSTITINYVHLYRSDLGGMVNNPDRGDSYVPTTSSAVYLPRRGHHKYNGDQWVNKGILAESEARTNLVTHSIPDSSNWLTLNLGTYDNNTTSPTGEQTATKIVAVNNSSGLTYIYKGGATVPAGNNTVSAFVKVDTGNVFWLYCQSVANYGYAYFDLSDKTTQASSGSVSTPSNLTIEEYGSGWYRLSAVFNVILSSSSGNGVGICDAKGSTTVTAGKSGFVWGFQLETLVSTPSSYIPTNGSSVTRAAESITVPYANLPWPTPTYIGDELVTNGTFDTDSNWIQHTTWNIAGGVATHSATSGGGLSQSWTPTAGSVYEITFTVSGATSGDFYYAFSSASGLVADQIKAPNRSSNGTYKEYLVADGTTVYHGVWGTSTFDGSVDNISVREINPLSVSIAMQGEMDYVDEGSFNDLEHVRWLNSSTSDFIRLRVDGAFGTGNFSAVQKVSGVEDSASTSSNFYTDGLAIPYNFASRNGSTFINGAVDGIALSANTTPTALPDLSTTNLLLAYNYMGTISEFRMWDKDIGDTGIAEATKPSLEPSLSLTFDGQPSSFTNTGLTL